MDSETDVCNVYPEVLVYSMQMEWMGLDGQTYINSSVRVEWSESDSIAVCELRYAVTPQQPDLSAHCARCLVQVLAFASLFLLLLRTLGVQHSARTAASPSPGASNVLALLDPPTHQRLRLPCPGVHTVQKRSLSAAAILEKRFHKPFVTARWECCLLACFPFPALHFY